MSSKPGTMNIMPMRPLPAARLRRVSSRLLPGRSGIITVLPSSLTWTKPGSPPRGETSIEPSGPAAETTQKGDSST